MIGYPGESPARRFCRRGPPESGSRVSPGPLPRPLAAAERGFRVGFGFFSEATGAPAYHAWTEALAAAGASPLAVGGGSEAPSGELDPSLARFHFFEAFTAHLRAASDPVLLALVIELAKTFCSDPGAAAHGGRPLPALTLIHGLLVPSRRERNPLESLLPA